MSILINGIRVNLPNKRRRIKIYKYIRDHIKDPNFNEGRGFCLMIQNTCEILKFNDLLVTIDGCKLCRYLELFPELYKYQPKPRKPYWFPLCSDKEGLEKRINLINEICKDLNIYNNKESD